MPRINVQISCKLPSGVNVEALGKNISAVVRNLTGASCHVVTNVTPLGTSKVDLWRERQRRRAGNIQMLDKVRSSD